jgi:hypothetical protein
LGRSEEGDTASLLVNEKEAKEGGGGGFWFPVKGGGAEDLRKSDMDMNFRYTSIIFRKNMSILQ